MEIKVKTQEGKNPQRNVGLGISNVLLPHEKDHFRSFEEALDSFAFHIPSPREEGGMSDNILLLR